MAENFGPFETNLTPDVVGLLLLEVLDCPISLEKNPKHGLNSIWPSYAAILVCFADYW